MGFQVWNATKSSVSHLQYILYFVTQENVCLFVCFEIYLLGCVLPQNLDNFHLNVSLCSYLLYWKGIRTSFPSTISLIFLYALPLCLFLTLIGLYLASTEYVVDTVLENKTQKQWKIKIFLCPLPSKYLKTSSVAEEMNMKQKVILKINMMKFILDNLVFLVYVSKFSNYLAAEKRLRSV